MESLFERFYQKMQYTETRFVRSLMDEIHWEARLIGIRGARGVGKTTLLLQHAKLHLPKNGTVLYATLDNIWFSSHRLYDLAEEFVKRGGTHLFLDEVHKYPDWSQEIKNIYDDFPTLFLPEIKLIRDNLGMFNPDKFLKLRILRDCIILCHIILL